MRKLPAVKRNPADVTDAVKADIRSCIEKLEEVNRATAEPLSIAAIAAIERGGDLTYLFRSLVEANPHLSQRRAEEICTHLSSRATSLIETARQLRIGIRYATWLYSGAPCKLYVDDAAGSDETQDVEHRKANGMRFEIERGAFINGTWTWPGREPGCRCVSRAVIPGFE